MRAHHRFRHVLCHLNVPLHVVSHGLQLVVSLPAEVPGHLHQMQHPRTASCTGQTTTPWQPHAPSDSGPPQRVDNRRAQYAHQPTDDLRRSSNIAKRCSNLADMPSGWLTTARMVKPKHPPTARYCLWLAGLALLSGPASGGLKHREVTMAIDTVQEMTDSWQRSIRSQTSTMPSSLPVAKHPAQGRHPDS